MRSTSPTSTSSEDRAHFVPGVLKPLCLENVTHHAREVVQDTGIRRPAPNALTLKGFPLCSGRVGAFWNRLFSGAVAAQYHRREPGTSGSKPD